MGRGNFYPAFIENIKWNDSQFENQNKKMNPLFKFAR